MKVSLEVTPTSGNATTEEVEVEATHVTFGAVRKAAGRLGDKWKLWVDGKPATDDTVVSASSKLSMTEPVRGS